MKYLKVPISISDQIEKLRERGLLFHDEQKAANYLSNISYYRLRAYTFPFQDNKNPDHPFVQQIFFEDIINLYVFDRRLRLLLFNALEKIEVALRTQIIYHYSLTYGAYWHTKPELFNNPLFFEEHLSLLQTEVDRSNETFIKHYKESYGDPEYPPSWMSLEVSSMGLLSKIFKNLKKEKCKDIITDNLGLKDVDILTNWMHCFSVLRNICAHHGRIWNRRLPSISLPRKTHFHFILNSKHIYSV